MARFSYFEDKNATVPVKGQLKQGLQIKSIQHHRIKFNITWARVNQNKGCVLTTLGPR